MWSSDIGDVEAVSGSEVLSVLAPCVVAVSAATGAVTWMASDPGHPYVAGLAAATDTVVVATGNEWGTAPAMVYPVVDGLVALNLSNGKPRWDLSLADDGQALPAVIDGPVVVVAETDGTVEGVGTLDGRLRWSHLVPADCIPANEGNASLNPGAAILTGGPEVVVAYPCTQGSVVVALAPGTGSVFWTWKAPAGWEVDTQAPTSPDDGVIGVVLSPGPSASVPAPAPEAAQSRAEWVLGPSQTDAMVAIGLDTGLPLWELDGVPIRPAVFGGADRLCVATVSGVECRDTLSGAAAWQWQPVAEPPPEMASLLFMPGPSPGVVVSGDRLYWAAPTSAAPASANPISVTPTPQPDLFDLRVTDLATGALIFSSTLPGYNEGPDGVGVSLSSPPGVLVVVTGTAFVSPELHEAGAVEALRVPS